MAAEIRAESSSPSSPVPTSSTTSSAKPELLNKVEGGAEEVHAAILIPGQDGIISISADRQNFFRILTCTLLITSYTNLYYISKLQIC